MQTIWKYILESTPDQKINIPKGAEILTVQLQREQLCLWAKVESDNQKEDVIIQIRGTGNHIGKVGEHLGTYQLDNGELVLHVFTSK